MYVAKEISHFPMNRFPGAVDKAWGPVVPVLNLSDVDDPSWSTIPIPRTVGGTPTTSDGCHKMDRVDTGGVYYPARYHRGHVYTGAQGLVALEIVGPGGG